MEFPLWATQEWNCDLGNRFARGTSDSSTYVTSNRRISLKKNAGLKCGCVLWVRIGAIILCSFLSGYVCARNSLWKLTNRDRLKVIYRVAQKNVYTFWHEKRYSIIVTTVFKQKQNWYERCPYLYVILHSHPEIEISFKFIPKILMSKECIHFFGPLCLMAHVFDMTDVFLPRLARR